MAKTAQHRTRNSLLSVIQLVESYVLAARKSFFREHGQAQDANRAGRILNGEVHCSLSVRKTDLPLEV